MEATARNKLYKVCVNGDVIYRHAMDREELKRNIQREYFGRFGRANITDIRFIKVKAEVKNVFN